MKQTNKLVQTGLWLLFSSILLGMQQVYADGTTIIAPDKTVWVADPFNNVIEHRNLDYSMIAQFGSTGEGPGQFHSPSQIAVAADGSLWVGDGEHYFDADNTTSNIYNTYRLQHLKADGTFINQFGSRGAGSGEFNHISEIAPAADGSLWVVSDIGIQHFKADGTLISQITDGLRSDIAFVTDGSIWVVNPVFKPMLTGGQNRFRHYTADGQLISYFLSDWGSFIAEDLSVAVDGSLWVTGNYKSYLHHFKTDGTLVEEFGDLVVFAGLQNHVPLDFTLSVDGNVWVSDVDRGLAHDIKAFHPFDPGILLLPTEYNEQQEKLILQDVTVGNEHYQAVLQKQNGQFKLLSADVASRLFKFPVYFGDEDPTVLHIPAVKASGRYYSVRLKHLGNYVFELQSATRLLF